MPRFVESFRLYWPQYLWVVLLFALIINITYLLWPQVPDAVVLRPHPLTLKPYAALPVLVEMSPASTEKEYQLIDPEKDKPLGSLTHTSSRGGATIHESFHEKKVFQGHMNLNTASLAQLEQLPGVGPKMAERILAYRQQHGGFQKVEQLMDVSGIGPKKYEKLASVCVVH